MARYAAAQTGHAADAHDAASLLRDHDRRHVLDAQEDAADVDRHKPVDGRNIDLADADHWRRNAGVVDQTIHAAEPIDRVIDHRLHVGFA